MKRVHELINESIEIIVRIIWIKCIEKETNKYNSLNQKAKVQAHIVRKMLERYNEIYDEGKSKSK